ncbi:MAG: helix-turn-helix domain-containing protein [Treponema sp.]|jgi:transcriptional regulator with XRE-family HTH domain|nr:helix-turn-helix domain-containing protein [Treponema sp.]
MEKSITGDDIRMILGKNLKRIRLLQNMSQLNLSSRTGLAHNFINDIENGKKWISPKTLAKLTAALKVEIYQFFLPEYKSDDPADNFFTVYLDDFSDNIQKMVGELKSRYLQDRDDDT